MHAIPRPVRSTQTTPHHDLARLVARHVAGAFRKPPAAYSVAAFDAFVRRWDKRRAPVLDAGCGTGAGTVALALRMPDRLIVGVDQSAHRLGRGLPADTLPANALLLRADVVDFWMLMRQHGIAPHAQYLLYPNPWPKPAQVMRRWPAHPVFPTIVALGGRIECRSNWRIYAEEFALAAGLLRGIAPVVETFTPDAPLTPFERKYGAAGQALYRVLLAPEGGKGAAA
jgi:tRNA (guanine-N7-)-methyltransferase